MNYFYIRLIEKPTPSLGPVFLSDRLSHIGKTFHCFCKTRYRLVGIAVLDPILYTMVNMTL